jgi:hypothetical protein
MMKIMAFMALQCAVREPGLRDSWLPNAIYVIPSASEESFP